MRILTVLSFCVVTFCLSNNSWGQAFNVQTLMSDAFSKNDLVDVVKQTISRQNSEKVVYTYKVGYDATKDRYELFIEFLPKVKTMLVEKVKGESENQFQFEAKKHCESTFSGLLNNPTLLSLNAARQLDSRGVYALFIGSCVYDIGNNQNTVNLLNSLLLLKDR